jgi:hypothetical protein
MGGYPSPLEGAIQKEHETELKRLLEMTPSLLEAKTIFQTITPLMVFSGHCKHENTAKILTKIEETSLKLDTLDQQSCLKIGATMCTVDIFLHPLKYTNQQASMDNVLKYLKDTAKVNAASLHPNIKKQISAIGNDAMSDTGSAAPSAKKRANSASGKKEKKAKKEKR